MPELIPKTMRAIAPTGPGGPEVLELMQRPVPNALGSQLLIQVQAAGVNRHDCNQRARGHGPKGATDVLGLEVAGVVVAAGPDADPAWIGQRVIALTNGGGYAEYCLAEAGLALPWPQTFSAVEAAGLPEALFTLQLNLMDMGRLSPGDWVLLHGGSGGVASIGIAFAKRKGASVAVTVGNEEKRQFCLERGADLAINYRTSDFADAILAATDGRGVDVILDVVGASYAKQNLRAVAPNGRILHLSPKGNLDIPLRDIMVKRACLSGALLRGVPLEHKLRLAAAIRTDLDNGAADDLRPAISQAFVLDEADAAHTLMESSAHMGKVMLLCSQLDGETLI